MSIDDLQLTGFNPPAGDRSSVAGSLRSGLALEALARGASDFDLRGILREFDRQHTAPGFEEPHWHRQSSLLTIDSDILDTALTAEITRAVTSFGTLIDTEFDALSEVARKGFKPGKSYPSAKAKYRAIRAIVYNMGYDHPFETIFEPVKEHRFLGQKVDGGVHEKFAEVLTNVDAELDKAGTGTAAALGKGFTSLLGLQVRVIDGTNRLSNHAFGLAIDLDPRYNPNIKNDFVPIVQEVTGVDFGHALAEAKLPDEAEVAAIHAKETAASDAFKAWLSIWLPLYKAKDSWVDPATAPGGPPIDPVAPGDDPVERQKNFALIDRLLALKETTMRNLEGWAQHGIITIPVQLAVAFATCKARWGAQYGDRKDTMHFEILAEEVLPPESKPRSLKGLMTGTLDVVAEARQIIREDLDKKLAKRRKKSRKKS